MTNKITFIIDTNSISYVNTEGEVVNIRRTDPHAQFIMDCLLKGVYPEETDQIKKRVNIFGRDIVYDPFAREISFALNKLFGDDIERAIRNSNDESRDEDGDVIFVEPKTNCNPNDHIDVKTQNEKLKKLADEDNKDVKVSFIGDFAVNITSHMAALQRDGYKAEFLKNFVTKMLQNPNYESIEYLYNFIMKNGIEIAEDGDIYVYKAVTCNYMDKYSASVNNSIGNVICMKREHVTFDPTCPCHQGLHVGALEYARNFASPGDKILMVKVNPRDVVSVPNDCSFQKIRVCRYKVISLVEVVGDNCCYNNEQSTRVGSSVKCTPADIDNAKKTVQRGELCNSHRKWTEIEDNYILENWQTAVDNYTTDDICKTLGRSSEGILRRLRRLR